MALSEISKCVKNTAPGYGYLPDGANPSHPHTLHLTALLNSAAVPHCFGVPAPAVPTHSPLQPETFLKNSNPVMSTPAWNHFSVSNLSYGSGSDSLGQPRAPGGVVHISERVEWREEERFLSADVGSLLVWRKVNSSQGMERVPWGHQVPGHQRNPNSLDE